MIFCYKQDKTAVTPFYSIFHHSFALSLLVVCCRNDNDDHASFLYSYFFSTFRVMCMVVVSYDILR